MTTKPLEVRQFFVKSMAYFYYLGGPLLALSSGSSRMYRKSTDKLLCEVCSLSPFYRLKLQIEPHLTRCHYPLMTYLTLNRCSAANLTWVWISDSGADCNFWGKVTIFGNSARWFPFTVFMDFKYWQFMDWWMYLLSRQEGNLDIYPSFQRFPQMAEQHL